MVFCYQNCSDLLLEKNFQISRIYKRTIFGNIMFFPGGFSYLKKLNNNNSNWKKTLFRNMQEKLENQLENFFDLSFSNLVCILKWLNFRVRLLVLDHLHLPSFNPSMFGSFSIPSVSSCSSPDRLPNRKNSRRTSLWVQYIYLGVSPSLVSRWREVYSFWGI